MTHSLPNMQAPTLVVGALPAPIRDLLAAIRDALDVPLADRPVDDQQRAELLTRRAADTRVVVELLLTHGDTARAAARLREWTAEYPVGYATWQARTVQAAAEEQRLLDEQGQQIMPTPGAEADRRSEGWTCETHVRLPEDDRIPGDEAVSATVSSPRCPAAHPEDPTPCDGPVVVTVLDATNAGADGCEHHAARLLASLDRGRVYPLPDAPDGAAIRTFKAADETRPFCWYENAPRTRPETLSRAENRRGGEGQ